MLGERDLRAAAPAAKERRSVRGAAGSWRRRPRPSSSVPGAVPAARPPARPLVATGPVRSSRQGAAIRSTWRIRTRPRRTTHHHYRECGPPVGGRTPAIRSWSRGQRRRSRHEVHSRIPEPKPAVLSENPAVRSAGDTTTVPGSGRRDRPGARGSSRHRRARSRESAPSHTRPRRTIRSSPTCRSPLLRRPWDALPPASRPRPSRQ